MNTQVYEIYLVDDRVYGYAIDWYPPSRAVQGYDFRWSLVRGEENVIIVTHDKIFTEEHARNFADALLRGAYTVHKVDFEELNTATENAKIDAENLAREAKARRVLKRGKKR